MIAMMNRIGMNPLFSQAPSVARMPYPLTLIPLLTDNAHNKGIRAEVFGVALATKGAFGNKGFFNHVNQENQANHVQTNAGTAQRINPSVSLCVPSVALCVTKNNHTENHREGTELHRDFNHIHHSNHIKITVQTIGKIKKKTYY